MADSHRELMALLGELEKMLRDEQLWHRQLPPPSELASTQPFACDTLEFTQWLQFIFIPRLRAMADTGARLPAKCEVAPMAEEYFKANAIEATVVIHQIRLIDRHITECE